jgi:AmmeMemoRadiSam system protein A
VGWAAPSFRQETTILTQVFPDWAAVARDAIERAVRGGDPADGGVTTAANEQACGGVFVTLHKFGRLRGCMGILEPQDLLADAVRQAAVCAALQDPRFHPVSAAELGDLEIEVSVMSQPRAIRELAEIELGRHGIIVGRGRNRGLFLPQVATEYHFDREEFLSRCCSEKAGLPPDAWRDAGTQVLIFTTEVFSESR